MFGFGELFAVVSENPQANIEVNLPEQHIRILLSGATEGFDINSYKKTCLLNGYDDIDYLLNMKTEIEAFEEAK